MPSTTCNCQNRVIYFTCAAIGTMHCAPASLSNRVPLAHMNACTLSPKPHSVGMLQFLTCRAKEGQAQKLGVYKAVIQPHTCRIIRLRTVSKGYANTPATHDPQRCISGIIRNAICARSCWLDVVPTFVAHTGPSRVCCGTHKCSNNLPNVAHAGLNATKQKSTQKFRR